MVPPHRIWRNVSPWYRKAFGPLYQAVYAHRNDVEAEAIVELVASIHPLEGRRLLDLATGAGRIARGLSQRGATVLGLDLSPHLLKTARSTDPSVPLVRGDMRWLPLGDRAVDGVLLIFTSFGYFREDSENFQVLDEVRRVLKDDGFFLLDLINAAWIRRNLVPRSLRREGDLEISEERAFENCGTRLVKKVSVRHLTEGWTEAWEEDVRLYDADRVREEIEARSLAITRLWGGYDGVPWGRRTPRMIVFAEGTGGGVHE
jgi:ubiquinone/menaquinone biosynthesis C-methylase UbiE